MIIDRNLLSTRGVYLTLGHWLLATGDSPRVLNASDSEATPPNFAFNSSEVRVWREGCGSGWRAHCDWALVVLKSSERDRRDRLIGHKTLLYLRHRAAGWLGGVGGSDGDPCTGGPASSGAGHRCHHSNAAILTHKIILFGTIGRNRRNRNCTNLAKPPHKLLSRRLRGPLSPSATHYSLF